MSGKAFVDTNVLVYAHDPQGGAKSIRARRLVRQLWLEKSGVLSTQVLQEFCVNVRRKFLHPMSTEEFGELLGDYMKWHTVVNSGESIVRALEIERRYQLSFWDAMIVQAAASARCEVLYSEDLSHGQEYQGVLVVNPFMS
ncbi:MAG TPA: PIN domain-containing protein [Candidatus Acidoferrum sp.]|nr:PIN domain-containing protein [Candidatus Acidoferrum sp.]